jgi:hypothetical protein
VPLHRDKPRSNQLIHVVANGRRADRDGFGELFAGAWALGDETEEPEADRIPERAKDLDQPIDDFLVLIHVYLSTPDYDNSTNIEITVAADMQSVKRSRDVISLLNTRIAGSTGEADNERRRLFLRGLVRNMCTCRMDDTPPLNG